MFPLLSYNWLLFYGPKYREYYNSNVEYEAFLLPLYNNPQIIHLNNTSMCRAEQFFYHDPKYIIYTKFSYESYFTFEIFKVNGTPVQNIKLDIKG